MALAPFRFCSRPGCPHKVRGGGRCASCRQAYDRGRGTARERQYDSRWDRYSKDRLAQHPWCVGYPAGVHTVPTLASVTDHKQSARARPDLFWDPSNHQSLCGPCNRKKAIQEEGGFGRS